MDEKEDEPEELEAISSESGPGTGWLASALLRLVAVERRVVACSKSIG